MSKITLNNVGSLLDVTTAQSTINANSNVIQTAFDNTLSRDGLAPNQMQAVLDMNSHRIINLPAPASNADPVRYIDITDGFPINVTVSGISFDTLLQAQLAIIPNVVNYLQINGYYAYGDGGLAHYNRVSTQPSHNGKFQSADGTWWELSEIIPNVRMFGAHGDASTSDSASIQNCINYAVAKNPSVATKPTVKIGPGIYFLGSTVSISNSIRIEMEGKFLLTTGIPCILINTSINNLYDIELDGLSAVSGTSGDRTLESLVRFEGGFSCYYLQAKNISVEGIYKVFDLGGLIGTGQVQWNRITDFRMRNNGALTCGYFWYDPIGASGSQLFGQGVVGCNQYGFFIDGSNNVGCGDTQFDNIQFSGPCTGIKMVGKVGTYGTNVKMTNLGLDAGVTVGFDFTGMNNFSAKQCNWGGATTAYVLNNCFDYNIDGVGGTNLGVNTDARQTMVGGLINDPLCTTKWERATNAKNGLPATSSSPIFLLDLSNNVNSSAYVKIVSQGLQQGIGVAQVVTEWRVIRNAGTVTATVLRNDASGLTHTIATSTAQISFSVGSPGNVGSLFHSAIEIIGNYSSLIRL